MHFRFTLMSYSIYGARNLAARWEGQVNSFPNIRKKDGFYAFLAVLSAAVRTMGK